LLRVDPKAQVSSGASMVDLAGGRQHAPPVL